MWFFYLLSWVATVVQILFLTLSIAAGLYYLADLIEEYTSASARLIKYVIWAVLAIHGCFLLFEELPHLLIVCGIVCHILYYCLLSTFPVVQLSSPVFIGGVVLLVINHVQAFSYFSSFYHPFSEVLAFFTICLWFVPFMFFVSLSANDLVLPNLAEKTTMTEGMLGTSQSDVITDYFSRRGKKYGLMSFFKYAQDSILPQRIKKKY